MRRLFRPKAILCGIFALASGLAQGEDARWTQFGLRPLGMGNAYVAVADDYNALFYNPAGLARLKTWHEQLFGLSGEVSENTLQLGQSVLDLAKGSSGDIDKVLQVLQGQTGKNQRFNLNWTPYLIVPGFGVAMGTDLGLTLSIHRDVSALLDFGPTVIAPVGIATNFLGDRLSVGVSAKLVARGGVYHDFSIQDIQDLTNKSSSGTAGTSSGTTSTSTSLQKYVQGGIGVGADAGILFTPVKTMEPTLGISVTDIGGTTFKKMDISGSALGTPPMRLPSVNVGVSLKPYQAHGMYVLLTSDADSINQPSSYTKKLNFGSELGLLGDFIKFDAGLYQGYWTGGFSFDAGLLTLHAVSYAEEMAPVAGTIPDRRYAVQLKLLI